MNLRKALNLLMVLIVFGMVIDIVMMITTRDWKNFIGFFSMKIAWILAAHGWRNQHERAEMWKGYADRLAELLQKEYRENLNHQLKVYDRELAEMKGVYENVK